MEKPLAAAAGIGWQGKHTNLVSRDFGSWLFLGAILTRSRASRRRGGDGPLRHLPRLSRHLPDRRLPGALPARCAPLHFLSHHRARGPIPREFRAAMGNRIYGCDDCLAVCPWNKFAQATHETKLEARDDLAAPPLADLAALDDAGFRARIFRLADQAHRPRSLPAQRIDRHRQFRVVRARATAPRRISPMPSPLVRGAAVWALSRLLPAKNFAGLKAQRVSRRPTRTFGKNGRPHERAALLPQPEGMAHVAGEEPRQGRRAVGRLPQGRRGEDRHHLQAGASTRRCASAGSMPSAAAAIRPGPSASRRARRAASGAR